MHCSSACRTLLESHAVAVSHQCSCSTRLQSTTSERRRIYAGQPHRMLIEVGIRYKLCLQALADKISAYNHPSHFHHSRFLTWTRLKFGEHVFTVDTPKTWNKLPLQPHPNFKHMSTSILHHRLWRRRCEAFTTDAKIIRLIRRRVAFFRRRRRSSFSTTITTWLIWNFPVVRTLAIENLAWHQRCDMTRYNACKNCHYI